MKRTNIGQLLFQVGSNLKRKKGKQQHSGQVNISKNL